MNTTLSLPETVTIPGAVALEALALLNAYADVLAEFRVDGEADPFYGIQNSVRKPLMDAIRYDVEKDLDQHPFYVAAYERSGELRKEIVAGFDGIILGAVAATKMAHDVVEVKTRLELDDAS